MRRFFAVSSQDFGAREREGRGVQGWGERLAVLLYDKDKNVVEMQISSDDDFKVLKEKCSKSRDKKD